MRYHQTGKRWNPILKNWENKNKAKTKLRSSFNNTSPTHVQRTSTGTCMVLTNLQQRVQACRSNISDPKFWLYPLWRHFSSKVYHSWGTESQHSQHTKQKSVRYIDWHVKQEPLKCKNGQQHPTIALEQQASTSSIANLKLMLMPDLILHLTKIVPSNSLPIRITTMSL